MFYTWYELNALYGPLCIDIFFPRSVAFTSPDGERLYAFVYAGLICVVDY